MYVLPSARNVEFLLNITLNIMLNKIDNPIESFDAMKRSIVCDNCTDILI